MSRLLELRHGAHLQSTPDIQEWQRVLGGTMDFVRWMVLVLAWSAGSQATEDERVWNVFGADSRTAVTQRSYPWSTVGYLPTGCTGTLIGRHWMLTAAHCALDGETGRLSRLFTFFEPNRIDGKSKTRSWMSDAWWGTAHPKTERAADWALVELKEPLGDTYGWMDLGDLVGDKVTAAGYSADFRLGKTAGAHVDCTIRDRRGHLLLSDCDTGRGSSGGPLFVMKGKRAVLVGLQVAEPRDGGRLSLHFPDFEEETGNIALPTENFRDEVLKRIRKIDALRSSAQAGI